MIYLTLNQTVEKGYYWSRSDNAYACGYAYNEGLYIEGGELAALFANISNMEDFHRRLLMLNGVFSVLVRQNEKIYAAVDKFGVFKLFYHLGKGNFFLSNDAGSVIEASGIKTLNKSAETDWYYAGFPAKNETLFEDLHCLNVSKTLFYDNDTQQIDIKRYNDFSQFKGNQDYSVLLKQLRSVFSNARDRFISSLNGKKVIIPLSGGVDSRLSALMLKEAGYTNVLCFTYGNVNDKESKIAKAAADLFGFEHIFIPYNKRQWREIFKNPEVHKYIKFASQYKATPHYNDFFAAKYLSERFKTDDCIIVPGHIGSIADSIMEPSRRYSRDEIIHLMIKKYFYYFGVKHKTGYNYLKNRLGDYYPESGKLKAEAAQELFNNAAYDTYRSSHLFMALRPYEFFGYKWRIPIMDDELVQFFQEVPLKYKTHSKVLLSDFILRESGGSVPLFKQPSTYLRKVMRNLKDKRLSCIKPFDVFKLRRKEYGLPGRHRILYRYYRNYLSYAAAETLRIILDEINND